jgi:hypothetical protein
MLNLRTKRSSWTIFTLPENAISSATSLTGAPISSSEHQNKVLMEYVLQLEPDVRNQTKKISSSIMKRCQSTLRSAVLMRSSTFGGPIDVSMMKNVMEKDAVIILVGVLEKVTAT